MAIEQLKYKNENGTVITAYWDTTYGIRPELSSDDESWFVLATDPSQEEKTDFSGAFPKK